MKRLIFTVTALLTIQSAMFAQCAASFTSSISGTTATFSVTSTPPVYSGLLNPQNFWYYGDGHSDAVNFHTYGASGTYTVSLIRTWKDSMTNAVVCRDSVASAVVITAPKQITGYVAVDSGLQSNPLNPSFKIWLIKYDFATQDLSAIDSVMLTGTAGAGLYTFNNEAAGSYLVKAMLTNGPASGTGSIPTYGYDSLYWHGADVITYSGTGVSSGHNIYMQNGTVTTGPGFISGNVNAGANKGTQTTGTGEANVTVFLQNASGKVLSYKTTDASGAYSFSDLPAGSYKIYPEIAGAASTSANVTVGTAQVTGVNFTHHTISKTVTPSNVGVTNVTANSSFNIFPNPGTGVFNISWSSKTTAQVAQATVTDIAGRKVIETEVNMNAAAGNTKINLSNLNSGLYFININADGINYTNKIILQH